MGTLTCRGASAYAHYEYSYSTREDSNNVYVDLTMKFINDVAMGVQTAEGPGWMTWMANNWSFTNSAYSTIGIKGGESMRSAVTNAGGVQQYWQTSEAYTVHPVATLFTHNLTLTLPKGTSDVTANVKFGVAVQSTYYWDMFAPTTEVSITVSVPAKYKPVSGLVLTSSEIGTNSFKISANWTAGIESDGRTYVTANSKTKLIDNDPVVFNSSDGIVSNTKYKVSGRLCDATHTTENFETKEIYVWTYPIVNAPTLTLKSGYEHNTINVSVSASVSSSYDQFNYKLDNGSWTGWTTNKTYSFNELGGNSSHTITVKMKNTDSGYESAEKTSTITTWYNPLTDLSINLVNRWFWYLEVSSSFQYQGTSSNITKYEFDIGNQGYQIKSSNNHSRGSTTPGSSGNLAYNTSYTCKVRLTDNHGRTYTKSANFTTLDERSLYVNGVLREVKIIKPDGSVHYVTPNLLTVVQPNGTTVNMNKIINNDNRTQYQ